MGKGIRIGRIFGIDIRIDWSWLFIFFLVTWNLGVVFGQEHRDWSTGLAWGLAVVAALLLFASVLAHEMAHSLVAKSRGTPVRSITLFLFGGVSAIEREPSSAKGEFLMAILGPITSLVLGGILLVIGKAVSGIPDGFSIGNPAISKIGPGGILLLWLGSINIILGLFNLVPGFPLDGGRVLRSILWALWGDLRRATRWAAHVGQLVAWMLIISGISMVFGARLPFFGGGLVGGLWLAFIGWFLNTAAVNSYRRVVVQDVLEGVPVSRIMRSSPPTVTPGISVSDLVHDYVMKSDDQSFPVMEGDRLAGLVTMHDIRSVHRDAWDRRTVGEIMTPAADLITTGEDQDASEALAKMMGRDVRQLPVVRDGRLLGLLRRRDIVRWLQLDSEGKIYIPG